MRISINKDLLLSNLYVLGNGLPSKTPMPSLNGIKIEVVEGGAMLTASKSDVAIRTLIVDDTLSVEEEGDVLVNGKLLTEVIKKMNSQTVSLVTNGNLCTISGGKTTYKLTTMDTMTYPNIEFVQSETPITLNASTLVSMIKSTSFAASTSEKKPILTGVNFRMNEGNLVATATDSFRLAQSSFTVPNQEFAPITVPSKSLTDLFKCIGDYEGDLEISFLKNRMSVRFDNVEFQTILLDGNYPDTNKLTSLADMPHVLKFNRSELSGVIDRVSLMSPSDSSKDKEITYSVVTMTLNKDGATFSSKSNSLGEAKEELTPLSGLTEELNLNVAFSGSYFASAINSFKCDEVLIYLNRNDRPFIITETTNDNTKQLILPVRQ